MNYGCSNGSKDYLMIRKSSSKLKLGNVVIELHLSLTVLDCCCQNLLIETRFLKNQVQRISIELNFKIIKFQLIGSLVPDNPDAFYKCN